jgi:hypothetical protein
MQNNMWKQLVFGAVAGFAGSMAIQAMLMAHQKVSPQTMPPIRQDPGEFMLGKAKAALPRKARKRLPKPLEAASAKLLGLGYGMTFGGVYAMARPKTQRTLLEGAGDRHLGGWLSGLAAGREIDAARVETKTRASRRAHRGTCAVRRRNRSRLPMVAGPGGNLGGWVGWAREPAPEDPRLGMSFWFQPPPFCCHRISR